MTGWEQFQWLLAKQQHRRCETCQLGFRTTPEFHDHNVFTHY